jgi:membrane associated rhomboid family serine protease
MLEDRDYMRQPEYPEPRWTPRFHPRWSWTVVLLISYAVVYLAEIIVSPVPRQLIPGNDFCYEYFALSLQGIEHGYVWQLLTYQFMHGSFLHIFLNCWAIYVFGREMESLLGARRFLTLYFSSGIIGGVFQLLGAWVWPQMFGGEVIGASACAFGLVAAFAMMFPEREISLLLFFIIPLTIRARTLLIVSAVLAVGGIFIPFGHIANAAHLGGMVMGWFFVRHILQGDWSRLGGFLHPAQKQPSRRPPLEALEKKPETGFVESEVDPILDKISAHGIQSLTSREREILETARKHIRRS